MSNVTQRMILTEFESTHAPLCTALAADFYGMSSKRSGSRRDGLGWPEREIRTGKPGRDSRRLFRLRYFGHILHQNSRSFHRFAMVLVGLIRTTLNVLTISFRLPVEQNQPVLSALFSRSSLLAQACTRSHLLLASLLWKISAKLRRCPPG